MTAAASGVVPDDTFTVSQAVNAIGFGKFQIVLSFVTGLCWMADSMEVMILSVLSPALHCEWRVGQYQQASQTRHFNRLYAKKEKRRERETTFYFPRLC